MDQPKSRSSLSLRTSLLRVEALLADSTIPQSYRASLEAQRDRLIREIWVIETGAPPPNATPPDPPIPHPKPPTLCRHGNIWIEM